MPTEGEAKEEKNLRKTLFGSIPVERYNFLRYSAYTAIFGIIITGTYLLSQFIFSGVDITLTPEQKNWFYLFIAVTIKFTKGITAIGKSDFKRSYENYYFRFMLGHSGTVPFLFL